LSLRDKRPIIIADVGIDLGIDLGTPVVEAIGAEHKSKFNGHIPKVTVDVRAPQPAPKPGWTAYDARRFGVQPLPGTTMTLQERAYTSPIWYTPGS